MPSKRPPLNYEKWISAPGGTSNYCGKLNGRMPQPEKEVELLRCDLHASVATEIQSGVECWLDQPRKKRKKSLNYLISTKSLVAIK